MSEWPSANVLISRGSESLCTYINLIALTLICFDHQDILQWDFMDTYNNLTIKSILALKWAPAFCSNAKFVIKMDDDVFLNAINLANFLESSYPHIEIAGQYHDLDARTVVR